MTTDKTTVALVSGPIVDLVPSNPKVQSIAIMLRWKDETLVRRVAAALPAIVEQRLYLQLAESFRIRPETMAGMLQVFRGNQPLQPHDFEKRDVGKNLEISRFDLVAEKLEMALGLIDKASDTYEFSVGALQMAKLVEIYGSQAGEIVEQIVENVEAIAAAMRSKKTPASVARAALMIVINRYSVEDHDRGRVDPANIEDMFVNRGPEWRKRDE